MRFLHTADLHIGKRVNEFSMLEDQEYILRQILKTADKEQVEAVLIAGDVYDKQVPSAEAVRLFDWFLTQLNSRKLPVFVIGGNHDSVERLSFGAQIMEESGVYLTQSYDGKVVLVRLEDEYGPVNLWMLPFLKPAMVKRFFPGAGHRHLPGRAGNGDRQYGTEQGGEKPSDRPSVRHRGSYGRIGGFGGSVCGRSRERGRFCVCRF